MREAEEAGEFQALWIKRLEIGTGILNVNLIFTRLVQNVLQNALFRVRQKRKIRTARKAPADQLAQITPTGSDGHVVGHSPGPALRRPPEGAGNPARADVSESTEAR